MQADDVALLALTKSDLDQMMQTCYEYSCKWRYTLNLQKTVVLVFGETISQHKRLHLKRRWKLGTYSVGEKSEHKHEGITLSSTLKNSEKVRAACQKCDQHYFLLSGLD